MVGIMAGTYPSLYLSSLNPIGIFRGGSINGSKSNFIRLLVTVQFTIAIFFITTTILFIKQLGYIHNLDLGIDDKNVVVIPTGLWYDNKEFKQELLRNPSILSVSASTYAPIGVGFKEPLSVNREGRMDTLQVNYYFVDEDFAKTYKLEVIKGQFLQVSSSDYWEALEKEKKSSTDGAEHSIFVPIVINETAEKMLGFNDPIGQRIGDDVIVGVIRDFHFRSLHYPIEPLVMSNNPEEIETMNVCIAQGNTSKTLNYIRDIYKKNRDNREFSYTFFDDLLNDIYQPETQLKNITIAFAILAIVISMMGILGMAIFSIDRRTNRLGYEEYAGKKVRKYFYCLIKNLSYGFY